MNKDVHSTMLAQPVQNISAKTNNVFTDILIFFIYNYRSKRIQNCLYKHDTKHSNTKYLNSEYQKVMEQNETLKFEIETLKVSIKSSETQLANFVSENDKLKTDSKQIVQELEDNISKMENDSIDSTNNF